MKLLILKVSDHRDPQVVASTWRAIFEDGMYINVLFVAVISEALINPLRETQLLQIQIWPPPRLLPKA